MKIIYLTQVFELEDDYGSDRHLFVCKKLKELGHQVTVITSNLHYRTSTKKFKTKWFRPVKINHQGIDLYYVYSPRNLLGKYFKRFLYYISYILFSLKMRKKLDKAHIVYAVSSPLSVALLGSLMSKKLKAEFYLEQTDIWPDVLIEMGFLKNKFIIFILRKIELTCYKKAKYIITLSKRGKENIQSKIQERKKVVLIPNGVDKELFSLKNEQYIEATQLKKKLNLENKFVCLYIGAHSLYNALFTIVETANYLKRNSEIAFVLIGNGDKKAQLLELAKNYKLSNIFFFPPIPRNKVPTWLQIADLFLLTNLKGEFFKMNLQNKFFDYLASSKPIIFAGDGESAEIILESNSGKVVSAEDYRAMANAIVELKSIDPEQRNEMGKNGRDYVLAHYERNQLFKKLKDLIESGIDKNHPQNHP